MTHGIFLYTSNNALSPAIQPQAYPWLHATAEGCKFGYQLLYLLEATPYYSPDLAILRQTVVRVSGTDLVRLPIPRHSTPKFEDNLIISLSGGTQQSPRTAPRVIHVIKISSSANYRS